MAASAFVGSNPSELRKCDSDSGLAKGKRRSVADPIANAGPAFDFVPVFRFNDFSRRVNLDCLPLTLYRPRSSSSASRWRSRSAILRKERA
jgi:hypothetical protein